MERCQRLALPGFQRWAVLMVSGGHFAGAIFAGSAVVLHKTMHSYVTRRGQGQGQLNRDQHGNAPRSAGASLRRYNQAQFLEVGKYPMVTSLYFINKIIIYIKMKIVVNYAKTAVTHQLYDSIFFFNV